MFSSSTASQSSFPAGEGFEWQTPLVTYGKEAVANMKMHLLQQHRADHRWRNMLMRPARCHVYDAACFV